MEKSMTKKNWWIVAAVAVVLAIALLLIAQQWLPDYEQFVFMLAFSLVGAAFCWVYALDREKLWWAIIVGLAAFTLVVTAIVALITPQDASGSSPFGVLTLGLGALVIGFVLKRPVAKSVLYSIALITLLVGLFMLPIALIWRIILVVVEVALVGYLIWQTNLKQT